MSDLSFYGVMVQVCADLGVWISMLLIIVTAVIPDILIRATRDIFSPAYNYRAEAKVGASLLTFEMFRHIRNKDGLIITYFIQKLQSKIQYRLICTSNKRKKPET